MGHVRKLAAVGLAAIGLTACAQPPDHAGNVTRNIGEQFRSMVEVVADPPDAVCTVTAGYAEKKVPDAAPRLVALAVRSEAPATVSCRKDGFAASSRTIDSTQTYPTAQRAATFLLTGVNGLTSERLYGTGMRFPPIVVVVLKPEQPAADAEAWRAEKRDLVSRRWSDFIADQQALCKQSREGRDCRSPDDLKPYIDADLAAL